MCGILRHLGYSKLFLLENRRTMAYLHSPTCFDDLKTLLDVFGNFLNELVALFIHFFSKFNKK